MASLASAALSLLASVAAASLGACGGGSPRASAPTPVAPFGADRAWADLERIVAFGPRPSGSPALEELRVWLEAELTAAGLSPVRERFRAETPAGPIEMANVYADLEAPPREGRPAPLVVLLSHFDTKRLDFPFAGANDGGSSTAVLLELARTVSAEPARRPVSYRFLFVDGEEAVRAVWQDPDNRYGSKHHVARLRERGELARVKAAVVIDMIGDKDLRLTTDPYSDPRLLGFFFDGAEQAGLGRHVRGPRLETKDDHLSFMEADVPACDLIDFDYGPRNAYWHDRRDTLENCSRESLDAAGRIVLAGLPALERWALER
jgi:hypothetical protein